MTTIWTRLNSWFFGKTDTWGLSLFRVLLGLLILIKFAFHYRDLNLWFTEEGLFPLSTLNRIVTDNRINLFQILDGVVDSVALAHWLWVATMLFASMFCLGLWTRFSALMMFVLVISFDNRNPYIVHGGDTLIRVLSFWMIFARSNAYFSLDQKFARNKIPHAAPAWPLRALQFQVAVMYFATFCHKIKGSSWWDGTAIYTVSQLIEFKRYPLPFLYSSWLFIKISTWITLIFEGSFAILVWWRKTKYHVLAFGVFFHLCLEWHYNIPIFQWVSIFSYAVFLDRQSITREGFANLARPISIRRWRRG